MADLGRPFGFWTFKAISTTLQTILILKNQQRAEADQIAMRVIRDFEAWIVNEHAEVFNRLKVQLDQIDDIALTKAFDEAKSSTMGFFNWRGINLFIDHGGGYKKTLALAVTT